ncbi:hypothetical protein [Clostridium sp. Marseille-Q2269]|uniref:hypothetical protein n=1 Tax=Clostridium sp. Marseille-Q2269 TaxID=2942205 RepID=UPI00207463AA|nr:hypothetical protein [Clostridium sp. Marseille-Q2269]
MGNMYKETVTRRTVPVLFFMLVLLVGILFLVELVKNIKFYDYRADEVLNISLLCIVILVIFLEVFKCKIKYSYFIIADQFIIHKIKGNYDKVVENIKLKDIIYFGKCTGIKSAINISNSKKYTCSLLNRYTYYCVYKHGNKTKKFYFEPSNNLISKIKYLSSKRLAS